MSKEPGALHCHAAGTEIRFDQPPPRGKALLQALRIMGGDGEVIQFGPALVDIVAPVGGDRGEQREIVSRQVV